MALCRSTTYYVGTSAASRHIFGFLVLFSGIWLAFLLIQWLATLPARRHGTSVRLNGPPRDSFILGVIRQLAKSDDVGLLFEQWSATYGPVFQIPTFFGGWRTIVCDPKAVNHFYSMERTVYVKSKLSRAVIANLFGHGLLWAEGDTHKRQRKALTPAFSIAAIRRLTTVFYDSSYNFETNPTDLRAQWDATLETSPDGAIIDVQHCLDGIGIAGFAHDFHSLDGAYSPVAAAFESFSFDGLSFFSNLVFILGLRFPLLAYLPFKRNRITAGLHRALSAIADDILQRSRREKMSRGRGVDDSEAGDRSVIGLLQRSLSAECVACSRHILGYATTSVSLTVRSLPLNLWWALIELARNPFKQAKLREELVGFGAGDPTYDQLGSGLLPYLDAVVLETLRLHPPVSESTREAIVDDVLPLREPVTTKSGETVHAIAVTKGSNRAHQERQQEFKPERWLTLGDGDDPHTVRARELQGHRHLLTFIDGPRACLGKSFALAEFKAVLIVLLRNFTYEFPDGPETTIVRRRGLVPRPAVQGQPGANVPLRVRRVE
ncbi:cytochrome P450 [Mycena pura]|uniref:Cytochrome P450 n=1 Tax=Mycena pura TaxID=153505 RepID=A0AAD6Y7I3_9AGAR|nr:cytochrome P450 [Mycena pura]